jgi:hypothetical protein
MKIIVRNRSRILVKDDGNEVYVNDGDIIQYTGIYHKIINDIVQTVKIETTFVGKVICEKYRHDDGILGIYVEPMFIFNLMYDEWNKIINYKTPTTKYFVYPHMLLVSQPHCFKYTQHKSLDEFAAVTKCIDLCM